MDIIHQAPQSVRSFRQEYWSGWPFPSPGNLPNPGIKVESPSLAGRFSMTEPPVKPSPPPNGTISNCNFAALLLYWSCCCIGPRLWSSVSYLDVWIHQIMRLNAPKKFSPYEVPIDWSQKCSFPQSHYFLFMNKKNYKQIQTVGEGQR